MSMFLQLLAAAGEATTPSGGADSGGLPGGEIASIVGLLNYGVLGVITVGFIRGWVVSPKERDRLIEDTRELKKESADKDIEIARLNAVMQEQLQAMVRNTDKQIELWSRRLDQRSDRGRDGSYGDDLGH